MTGLSTSAVSTLVADLIEAEVLVELGTTASGAGGRPAVALGLAPRAGSLVGIHLGHADLRVVLTSLDGTVLMQQRTSSTSTTNRQRHWISWLGAQPICSGRGTSTELECSR